MAQGWHKGERATKSIGSGGWQCGPHWLRWRCGAILAQVALWAMGKPPPAVVRHKDKSLQAHKESPSLQYLTWSDFT